MDVHGSLKIILMMLFIQISASNFADGSDVTLPFLNASADQINLTIKNNVYSYNVSNSTFSSVPYLSSYTITDCGGYLIYKPMILVQDKNVHVFAIGGDHALWDFFNGNWISLGGYITSEPFPIIDYMGYIHVFVKGGDNALWDCVLDATNKDPTFWAHNWYCRGGSFVGNVSAARDPVFEGVINIATRSGTNEVSLYELNTHLGWGSWSNLGKGGSGLTADPAIVNIDRRTWAIFSNENTHIYYNQATFYPDGSISYEWHTTDMLTSASAAVPFSHAIDPDSNNRTIYVFFRAYNNAEEVYELKWDNWNLTLVPAAYSLGIGGGLKGTPNPILDENGFLHVFVRNNLDYLVDDIHVDPLSIMRLMQVGIVSLPVSITSDPSSELVDLGTHKEVWTVVRGDNYSLRICKLL